MDQAETEVQPTESSTIAGKRPERDHDRERDRECQLHRFIQAPVQSVAGLLRPALQPEKEPENHRIKSDRDRTTLSTERTSSN